jgi:predicted small lipoprotein YifL
MVRRLSELSMPLSPSCARILIAGGVVLMLAACGRRGALEAPPDPAAAQQAQATSQPAAGTLPSPVGTPSDSTPKRGFVVPKDPFILDPLL